MSRRKSLQAIALKPLVQVTFWGYAPEKANPCASAQHGKLQISQARPARLQLEQITRRPRPDAVRHRHAATMPPVRRAIASGHFPEPVAIARADPGIAAAANV